MSRYKHHSVMLVPAAQRDAVNAALERHGYGPDNFSIEMQRGNATTHYACSITMTSVMRQIIRDALIPTGGVEHRNKSLSDVERDENLQRRNRSAMARRP